MKYIDVINLCTESCFFQAVEEVNGSPGYLQSREVNNNTLQINTELLFMIVDDY